MQNENYIKKDMTDYVFANRSKFCGIYGDEDGIFTPLSLNLIKNTLQEQGEAARVKIIKGASHSVYIHKQTEFLTALRDTCKL